jgi:kinesin family protein 15
MDAEQEAAKAYKQIDKLKKKYEIAISTLKELLAKSRLPMEEEIQPTCNDFVMPTDSDTQAPHSVNQHQPFYNEVDSELAKLEEPSWFSGHDRCNI